MDELERRLANYYYPEKDKSDLKNKDLIRAKAKLIYSVFRRYDNDGTFSYWLKRAFDVAVPPKMNEDQIAERLQKIRFAKNEEDARRIIPDLVTMRFETLPGSCEAGVGEVSCGRNGEPRYTAYTHPLV